MLYISMGLGVVFAAILARPILGMAKDGGMAFINYRKEKVPVAIGLVIYAAVIGLALTRHFLQWDVDFKYLFIITGVFVIGFLDDVIQDKENKGFKGHFKAFFKGKLTTGFLKAMGIPLLLLFYFSWDNYLVIIDLAFIALAVNLFNFFDLRPGRCQKVFLGANILLLPLFLELTPLYIGILGIVAFTVFLDLRERGMLGDAGANLLGIVTGLNLLQLPTTPKYIIYGLIVILTIIGEKYSFTKIIEGNSVLRYLDMLGRRKT